MEQFLERRRLPTAAARDLHDSVVLAAAGNEIAVPGRGDRTYPFQEAVGDNARSSSFAGVSSTAGEAAALRLNATAPMSSAARAHPACGVIA
jgi:hypothetical protein